MTLSQADEARVREIAREEITLRVPPGQWRMYDERIEALKDRLDKLPNYEGALRDIRSALGLSEHDDHEHVIETIRAMRAARIPSPTSVGWETTITRSSGDRIEGVSVSPKFETPSPLRGSGERAEDRAWNAYQSPGPIVLNIAAEICAAESAAREKAIRECADLISKRGAEKFHPATIGRLDADREAQAIRALLATPGATEAKT